MSDTAEVNPKMEMYLIVSYKPLYRDTYSEPKEYKIKQYIQANFTKYETELVPKSLPTGLKDIGPLAIQIPKAKGHTSLTSIRKFSGYNKQLQKANTKPTTTTADPDRQQTHHPKELYFCTSKSFHLLSPSIKKCLFSIPIKESGNPFN